jgi:hypothetical protein
MDRKEKLKMEYSIFGIILFVIWLGWVFKEIWLDSEKDVIDLLKDVQAEDEINASMEIALIEERQKMTKSDYAKQEWHRSKSPKPKWRNPVFAERVTRKIEKEIKNS